MSPTKKGAARQNATQQVNKGKPICSSRTLRSSSIVTPMNKNEKKEKNSKPDNSNISGSNMVSKLLYCTMYVECPYSLPVYLHFWVLYFRCIILGKINNFDIFQRK
jgi:hypothetical protein